MSTLVRNCSALFCGNFHGIYGNFPWNQRHISVKSTETFHGINGMFPLNLWKLSMESMAYFHRNYGIVPWNQWHIFHRIYGIVPWNPLTFCGINSKNLWHFMTFPNFLLLIYLPSTAMETLKTPSEYSVDFNRRFQEFSMANLEKGYYL